MHNAPTFEHFVMTRFNIASPGREEAIRTQPGWLDGRFDLFERFCLPSVLAQTSRAFRWIIYFDRDTPEPYRQRIGQLSRDGAFVPYFTPLFPADGWRRSLIETFAPKADLVLTTRLDNDDALARDFVARLHDAVRTRGHAVGSYNFEWGLVRQGAALYRIRHRCNAFFSRLERNRPDLRPAPSIQHMRIGEMGAVFQIGGEPAWMQVIHDTNVSNRIRGSRVSDPALAARFAGAAAEGLAPVSPARALAENATLGTIRRLRDGLSTAVQRMRRA